MAKPGALSGAAGERSPLVPRSLGGTGPAAASCLFSAPLASLPLVALLRLTFSRRLLSFSCCFRAVGRRERRREGRRVVGSVVAEGARQRRSSWRRRDGVRMAEPDSSRDHRTQKKKTRLSCTNVDILLFGAKADDEVAPPPPRAVPGRVGLSGSWRCEGTGNR